MLTYNMAHKQNMPLYQYLYQCIREDILNGVIKADEKLPSKRALAKNLSISIITVENAYNQLLMEGYLYSIEKVGYFAEALEKRSDAVSDKPIFTKEIREYDYFANFQANKIIPDMFPSANWAKLLRGIVSMNDKGFLLTVPYNGIGKLRYAIANYLHDFRGMKVSPDQIIIGSGSEYLYNRLLQIFGSGAVLGLENPGNHKFAKIAAFYKISCEYIPLDEEGINIVKLNDSKVNLLHLSPANHFPTGMVTPIKRRLQILQWLSNEPNRYIIEDDYDSELRYVGTMIPPIFTNDRNQRVIYMNSFSKSLAPSLRISYMVLPPELLKPYVDTTSFYSCTVSSFEQYVLASFLSEGYFERHLNRLRKFYKAQRDAIIKELEKSHLNDISTIVEHHAGTGFMLKVHTDLTKAEILENAKREDIQIAFLDDYTQNPTPEMANTLILNYASILPERIPEAIRRLNRIFWPNMLP